MASFHETICRLEDRLSQTSRDIYSTLQSSLSLGGQGRSGVALLQSKGSDTGLLAFGLARQMLESGRRATTAWQMTYLHATGDTFDSIRLLLCLFRYAVAGTLMAMKLF